MRVGIAADHGGDGLKETFAAASLPRGMTLLTSVQTGSSLATTTRISLFRWRGQWRQAR